MDLKISEGAFDPEADVALFHMDCLEMLARIPDGSVRLVVTSPPYNIGKEYERTRTTLVEYKNFQREVIAECHRVLMDGGSLCWQVGNHVDKGEVIPLDSVVFPVFMKLGFVPRNRIVWHFEHGLHCTHRFSGRYETINWFTKGRGTYHFNLDPVRVPQKYPGKKHYRGPKAGQYSGNPLGKNPADVWIVPNVKHNHVEKTDHPCQYPVELVERLVLSMSKPGEWVLDPFLGSGTTAVAALLNGRRAVGAELVDRYVEIIRSRIAQVADGTIKYRERNRPVHVNGPNCARSVNPWVKTNAATEG